MSFDYVSGNPALDLAGTRKWRREDSPEELLRQPSDLARWFDGLPDVPEGLEVDRSAFAVALDLREASYRLAGERLSGDDFDPTSLAVVNALAARPGLRVRLTPTGLEREGSALEALADIARAAIEVLSDPETCLKECGRPACTRIYVDRSRGARRTWCGMDECGNRVKAAAYRARKRADVTV